MTHWVEENEEEIYRQNQTILKLISELRKVNQEKSTLKKDGGLDADQNTMLIDLSWIDKIQKSTKKENDEPTKMEKWEFEKKLNKKLEIAKSKLLKKTKELSDSEKIIHSLRAAVERIDKDRTRLSMKVTQLNNRISSNNDFSQKEELEKNLSEKVLCISELEQKIVKLERDYIKSLNEERKEYEMELSKYDENEKKLESKIMALESCVKDRSKSSEDIEFSMKSGNSMENMESGNEIILKEVNDKCKKLEKEKLKLESDLLEIKLEKERLAASLMHNSKEAEIHHISQQSLPSLPKKRTDYKGKTSNELLQVIDQLTRAIEKVKAENEALKRTAINPVKYQEALRDLKTLRDELEKAVDERKNADLYVRQSSRYSYYISINTRLEEENSKTQKLYKKEVVKNAKLASQIQELTINSEAMNKELMLIRRNIGTNGITLETVEELRKVIKNLEQDIAKNVLYYRY